MGNHFTNSKIDDVEGISNEAALQIFTSFMLRCDSEALADREGLGTCWDTFKGGKQLKEIDALLGPFHDSSVTDTVKTDKKVEEEELLRGLLDENDREFVLSKLISPPSDTSNEAVKIFVDLIKKRLFFLVAKRESYQRAFQAQITNHLEGLQAESSVSQLPKAAEIGIRAGVRLMISLLRSVSAMDQLLRQDALDFFLELLSELKPLDLWGDGNMSLLLDKSFHSVAGFLDEIVSSPDVDDQMKSKAVKILLGFGLARGSLPNLLLVTEIMLGKSPKFELPLSDELKLLGNELPALELSSPDLLKSVLSNPINGLDNIVPHENEKEGDKKKTLDKREFCAIAGDGKYIYCHGKHGLAKIGSGFNDTVEGKLYNIVPDFHVKEKGWLCCVSNKLYYRSIEISPKPFLIVDCQTLVEDTENINYTSFDEAFFISEQNPSAGSGEDLTSSRSRGASESKENIIHFDSKEDEASTRTPILETTISTAPTPVAEGVNEDKIRLPSNRSPIITDGRFIYLVSQWTREADENHGSGRGGNGDEEEDAAPTADGSHHEDEDHEEEGESSGPRGRGLRRRGRRGHSDSHSGSDDDEDDEDEDEDDGENSEDNSDVDETIRTATGSVNTASMRSRKKKGKRILPRFGVDCFDPLNNMKHVRRVELLHSRAELENKSLEAHLDPVIPISSLRECSFITNGSKLIMIQITVPDKAKRQRKKRSINTFESTSTIFDLNTGHCIPIKKTSNATKNTLFGVPSMYDYFNNLIWNASSNGGSFIASRNIGLAPCFNFQTGASNDVSAESQIVSLETILHLDKLSSKSFEVNKWSIFGQSAAFGFVTDLGPSLPSLESAAYILANLSRLAKYYLSNLEDLSFQLSPLNPEQCVRKPHCIHLNPETFRLLSNLLKVCMNCYTSTSFDASKKVKMQCFINLLVILKANIHYLVIGSIPPTAVGLKTSSDQNSVLDNISQIIFHLAEQKTLPSDIDPLIGKALLMESLEIISISLHILVPSSSRRLTYLNNAINNLAGYNALYTSAITRWFSRPQAVASFVAPLLHNEDVLSNIITNMNKSVINFFMELADSDKTQKVLVAIIAKLFDYSMENIKLYKNQSGSFVKFSNSPVFVEYVRLFEAIVNFVMNTAASHLQEDEIQRSKTEHQSFILLNTIISNFITQSVELLNTVQSVAVTLKYNDKKSFLSFWNDAFKESMIGRCLPSLLSSVSIFAGNKGFSFGILSSGNNLFVALDACIQISKTQCSLDDIITLHNQAQGLSVSEESSHPVEKNQKKEYNINIPGANSLLLFFDSKCFAKKGSEFIQVYKGKLKIRDFSEKKAIGPRYWNDEEKNISNFPLQGKGVEIPGDTCTIYHESGPLGTSWGFKVVAYGTSSAPILSMNWLFDLQRSLCFMISKAASLLLIGLKITEDERKFAILLNSQLLCGGLMPDTSNVSPSDGSFQQIAESLEIDIPGFGKLEDIGASSNINFDEANFMNDMLDYKAGSNAVSFSLSLNKALVKKIFAARVGGEVAQQLVAATFAVMLKHTGKLKSACSIANKIKDSGEIDLTDAIQLELFDLWKTSSEIRSWVQEKKSQLADVENGFSKVVTAYIRRASFISSVESAHVSGLSSGRKSFLPNTNLTADDWKTLVSSWRSGSKSATKSSANDIEMTSTLSITSSILLFLRSGFSVKKIKEVMIRRRSRAIGRILGLNILDSLYKNSKSSILRQDIVGWLSSSLLTKGSTSETLSHPLDNLQGCGVHLAEVVRNSFHSLVHSFLVGLKDSLLITNTEERAMNEAVATIQALRWRYGATDHQFLLKQGVFNLLRDGSEGSRKKWGVISDKENEDDPLEKLVWHFYKQLSLLVVDRTDKSVEIKSTDDEKVDDDHKRPPQLARAISTLDTNASKDLLEQSLHVLFNELNVADVSYRTSPAAEPLIKKVETETNKEKEDTVGKEATVVPENIDTKNIISNRSGDSTENLEAKKEKPKSNIYDPKFCLNILSLIYDMTAGKQQLVLVSIASPDRIAVLLSLLRSAPPDHRRLICRIFRCCLPYVAPSSLWTAVESAKELLALGPAHGPKFGTKFEVVEDNFETSGSELILMLLDIITGIRESIIHDYFSGEGEYRLSTEVIMLLRSLLATSSWATIVLSVFEGKLSKLASILTSDFAINADNLQVVIPGDTCICVLGGQFEGLRVGGSVLITNQDIEFGTLLECPANNLRGGSIKKDEKSKDKSVDKVFVMTKPNGNVKVTKEYPHALTPFTDFNISKETTDLIWKLESIRNSLLSGFKWALTTTSTSVGNVHLRAMLLKLMRISLQSVEAGQYFFEAGLLPNLILFATHAAPSKSFVPRSILEEKIFQLREYACESFSTVGKIKSIDADKEKVSKQISTAEEIATYGFNLDVCELALKKNPNANDAVLWILKYAEDLAKGWDGNALEGKEGKAADKKKSLASEEKISEAYSCKSNENQDKEIGELNKIYSGYLGSSFSGSNSEKLDEISVETEVTLAILYSRRGLLALLENWPEKSSVPLSLSLWGSPDALVDLLKLTSFESFMSGSFRNMSEIKQLKTASTVQSRSVLDRLSHILTKLLSVEGDSLSNCLVKKCLIEPLNNIFLESSKTESIKEITSETSALSDPFPNLALWLVEFMSGLGNQKSNLLSDFSIDTQKSGTILNDTEKKLLDAVYSVMKTEVFESLLSFSCVAKGLQKLSTLSLLNKVLERVSQSWINHFSNGGSPPPMINLSKHGNMQVHFVQLKRHLTVLRGTELDLHSTLCHHLFELMISTRKITLYENRYSKVEGLKQRSTIPSSEGDEIIDEDNVEIGSDDVLSRGKDPFLDDLFDISEVMHSTANRLNLPKSFILQAWIDSLPEEKRPDMSISFDAKTSYDKPISKLLSVPYATECTLSLSTVNQSLDTKTSVQFSLDKEGKQSLGGFGGDVSVSRSIQVLSGSFYMHYPLPAPTVYVWGANDNNQLGMKSSSNIVVPQRLDGIHGQRFIQASGGNGYSLFLSDIGTIYSCGRMPVAGHGKVGSGRIEIPKVIPSLERYKVIAVSAGDEHAAAVTDKGELWTWGQGGSGQLGHGDAVKKLGSINAPRMAATLSSYVVTNVACGYDHTLILLKEGEVYACGNGSSGQLGIEGKVSKSIPTKIDTLGECNVLSVVAGLSVSAAIVAPKGAGVEAGTVWTWGQGASGTCGHDNEDDVELPQEVAFTKDKKIIKISLKDSHILAASSQGYLYSWGSNSFGQLGVNSTTNSTKPLLVDLSGHKVLDIAAGKGYSLVLAEGEVNLEVPVDASVKKEEILSTTIHSSVVSTSDKGEEKKGEEKKEEKKEEEGDKGEDDEGDEEEGADDLDDDEKSFEIDDEEKEDDEEDEDGLKLSPSPDESSLVKTDPSSSATTLAEDSQTKSEGLKRRDGNIIFTFGSSKSGNLGHGKSSTNQKIPKVIENLEANDIQWLGGGATSSYAGRGMPLINMLERVASNPELLQEEVCRTAVTLEDVKLDIKEGEAKDEVKKIASFDLNVEPKLSSQGCQVLLKKHIDETTKFIKDGILAWNQEMDEQLVDLLNRIEEKDNKKLLDLKSCDLVIPDNLLKQFTLIENIPLDDIKARFSVIKTTNHLISRILPFINFCDAENSWSLAHIYCRLAGRVFWSVKSVLWNSLLSTSNDTGGGTSVTINRLKAAKGAGKGFPDDEGDWSIFGQIFKQLNSKDPKFFRAKDRAFNVKFKGEAAIDAGGPYREAITEMCIELQSKTLSLFIHCPNFQNEIGFNREKWCINPAAIQPSHLLMFEFVGKLFGLSLRSGNHLNLDLPSLIWQELVGVQCTRNDLELVDQYAVQNLDKILECTEESFTEASFSERFVTYLSNGSEVELKTGGKNINVTFENRLEYVKCVLNTRFSESRRQMEEIKRGLSTIVPLKMLSLMTWRELEVHVCGRPIMDLALLKLNTTYNGCSLEDEHIKWFWKAMEEYSSEEQALYLRFVWGRSRLPLSSKEFTKKHRIDAISLSNPDVYLPTAHTCFFSIDMPKYSAYEVLRDKLRYAFTHCTAIDTDGAPREVWSDSEEDDD